MKSSVQNKITLGFTASVIALLGIGWLSYRTTENLVAAQNWVNHTHEVINTLESGLAILTDAETSQRGYLLTGDEQFLKDFQAAQAKVDGWLEKLRSSTADNPKQLQRIKQLEPLISQRLALLNNRIKLRHTQGLQAAIDSVATHQGADLMRQVWQSITEMETVENELLQQRQLEAQASARINLAVILTGSALACLIGLVAVLIIRRDLGEHKRIEKLLEHERHLLSELMDNAEEDIYFKDREGRFVRINCHHAKRFGLDAPAAAIGKTDFDFFSEEHARQAREDELQVMRTGKPFAKEEKETWPDGRTTWALTVKFPLHDQLGNIAGTFGLSRDVTGRKHAEEKIIQLNEHLKQQTIQLETANKELESFSYSVSHDLRAPLRHIDGFVKLLDKQAREKLDQKSRNYLNIIADSAKNMGALIDDLLVFSRMGRTELRQTRVALDSLVHEAVDSVKNETNGRHINWKIGGLPEVKADPAMLRQVWVNLIANAAKYSRPRDPAEIEIGCADSNNGEFVFFVRDNGVGFDMQYAHKLFGVFQRLHRSEDFEGTGIGLANVNRIIHRHGGRTWAEGKVDEGATFFFSLPKTPIEMKG